MRETDGGNTSAALAAAARGAAWVREITAQTPWWAVSVVLHVLLITLAGLATMVVALPEREELVQVTMLASAREAKLNPPDEPKIPDPNEAPPPEVDATSFSNIIIPPNIQVEYGPKFQTNNPDLPDLGGARSDSKSRVFYDPYGVVDEPGGGSGDAPSLEESVIGALGNSGHSTGSGWGNTEGPGIGIGHGRGRGSWGDWRSSSRIFMAKKFGSPETLEPVNRALHWLAYHQEPDGHWDAVKYGPAQKTDTAMTGLALLAFLGAGHSDRVGEYKDIIKRTELWLRSKQAPDGLIFDGTDAGAHRGIGYPTAIATLALVEASGMSADPALREAAQRAVTYCCDVHQAGASGGERMGWRYQANMEGDMSVSGWFIMALKSAKVVGLTVNHKALEGAIRFLNTVEHKGESNDPAYAPASVYYYRPNEPHEATQHRLTAIGCLCRQFLGWKKDDLQSTVEGFVNKGGVPSDHVDLYYWYYGSLCTFQQGGAVWDRWNQAMKTTLMGTQRHDGDEEGSWDPRGDFCDEWGRVGQTALSCLCLEVYYRYLRIGEM